MKLPCGSQPAATSNTMAARRLSGMAAVLLAALLGLALPALLASPASAAGKGDVYVIHGIPGEALDIYVDDEKVLAGAKPKTIVGPLSLNAGAHQVSLRKADKPIATSKFKVGGGQSVDVVAHLRSDMAMGPTLTAFRNDLSAVGPGKLRLAVAHTAAAPPADIRVNGDVLFSNVANGETLTVVVPAATYKVDIVPAAAAGDPILGPVDLKLKKATLTRVFAIGNVSKGTMDAVIHSLPIPVAGSAAPRSVPTGDGGQTASEFVGSQSGVADLMMASGLGLFGAAGIIAVSRRRMRNRVQP